MLGLRYVQLGSVEWLSLPVHRSGVLGVGMDGGYDIYIVILRASEIGLGGLKAGLRGKGCRQGCECNQTARGLAMHNTTTEPLGT